ncbi:MAG: response regulator transcription factor [Anaerolineales bacterium]
MSSQTSSLRVLIVDDHQVWTDGLALSLERHGLKPVAIIHDGAKVIEACTAHQPDVVLLDIKLPGTDGLQILSDFRTEIPDTAVLILTGSSDPTLPRRTLELGADGFLSKAANGDELAAKIRHAVEDHRAVSSGTTESGPAEPQPDSKLTATEEQVLRYLARGMDNAAIAERMTISDNTVKSHVSHLLAKLQVPNRTLAAVWAIDHGMVETPNPDSRPS